MNWLIDALSKLFGGGGGSSGGSAAGTALSGGLAGAGVLGNLLSAITSGGVEGGLNKQLKSIEGMSPASFSSMVSSAEAPINAGLVQSIGNRVQGDLASRGLAQAPGIFASEESQALGPIEQQNYQVALQQTLAKLGLPLQYAALIQKMLPGQQSMTPALQQLLKALAANQKNNANAGVSASGNPLGPLSSGTLPTNWAGPTDPNSGSGSGDLDLSSLVSA